MRRRFFAIPVLTLALAALLFALPLRGAAHDDGAGTPDASPMAGQMGGHGATGNGAAYMVITNAGTTSDRLVGGETEVASVVEIHEIIDRDGMMEMRPLTDGLTLPAGETVTLEPGGYHVMLIGLTRSLEPGMTFDLTLELAESGEVVVPVTVRARAEATTEAGAISAGDLTISDPWARPAPMLMPGATPGAMPEATPAS